MFTKILIANRGEIACRVAATARRMGIRSVAVYSDADAKAQHVMACDEAVHIGSAAAKESYLLGERIIAAALATGAQAIHPGYGFLSENAAFAQACADNGLVYIGPPPGAIKAMGLKAESKQLMEHAGVPLVPGYHGADQDAALLQREAARIGYPVLIKASAGGGGKGMRVVLQAADFEAALASCKREAINSFGNDAVLVERYVQRPRHIEIQVFCDSHGNGVYLFERDCSVQRRHQKVLEEAPAPGMTPERRAQMGEAAVAAAKAVSYQGAGTVEFIVEQGASAPSGGSASAQAPSVGASHNLSAAGQPQGASAPSGGSAGALAPSVGAFYFMEMNTRLQVEHPVTEAITGFDLVEWQLRVAAGQRLPTLQHQLAIKGHAIEARICAENPDNNFLPATGTLHALHMPAHVAFTRNADHEITAPTLGAGAPSLPPEGTLAPWGVPAALVHDPAPVRIDAGVVQGDTISPYYDSMVAKLIVWGADRAQALARLDAALAELHIVGLQTNVAFLRRVVRSTAFASADLDTGLIERERAALFNVQELSDFDACAAAVLHIVAAEQAGATADPWSQRDGWRMNSISQRSFTFKRGERELVAVLAYEADVLRLSLAETSSIISLNKSGVVSYLHANGAIKSVAMYRLHDAIHVFCPAGSAVLELQDLLAHAGDEHSDVGRLTAPMPGKVIALLAKVGDAVKKGQALAVMEAMKMEHTIAAPVDGVVAELPYAVGDQVTDGAELVRFVV